MSNPAPQAAKSLFLVSAIAACAVIFTLTAALALRGEPYAFDRDILLALRDAGDLSKPAGPGWIVAAAKDITMLGGTPFLTILTLAITGYFIVRREWVFIAVLLAAVFGESVIVNVLKGLFGRMRPDVVPHLVEAASGSFPSGHSASAAAIYLTLAALMASRTGERAVRRYLVFVAIMLALLVGASRVYLGVHYPTDVIGGLAFGSAWAAMVWFAARKFGVGGNTSLKRAP
jgi:undecaprenyl-diphosphatase